MMMKCLMTMPTINRLPRKPKSTAHNNTDNRELRAKAYNNTAWRKVRQTYLQNHPLCEECLKEGKVNAGTLEEPLHVHHKRSPFANGTINYDLLLDDTNLETICSYHHGLEHSDTPSPETIIAILDDLLLNDDWGDDHD